MCAETVASDILILRAEMIEGSEVLGSMPSYKVPSIIPAMPGRGRHY